MRAAALLSALFVAGALSAKTQRSAAELLTFKRHTPCSSTGLRSGACPGYLVDHANPLSAGGTDTRDSIQWLAGVVQLEIAAHPVASHMDKVSAEAASALRQEGCHTFFSKPGTSQID